MKFIDFFFKSSFFWDFPVVVVVHCDLGCFQCLWGFDSFSLWWTLDYVGVRREWKLSIEKRRVEDDEDLKKSKKNVLTKGKWKMRKRWEEKRRNSRQKWGHTICIWSIMWVLTSSQNDFVSPFSFCCTFIHQAFARFFFFCCLLLIFLA